MTESIQFSFDLPVSPERVYRAWFDPYEHSQFTGSPAEIDARVGGSFKTRDGYIQGETLVMTPYSHIVQSWRTRDFPAGSPDSRLDLELEPTCLGTQVHLAQDNIPDGQSGRYLEEWEGQYFRPMLNYFEVLVGDSAVDIEG